MSIQVGMQPMRKESDETRRVNIGQSEGMGVSGLTQETFSDGGNHKEEVKIL